MSASKNHINGEAVAGGRKHPQDGDGANRQALEHLYMVRTDFDREINKIFLVAKMRFDFAEPD